MSCHNIVVKHKTKIFGHNKKKYVSQNKTKRFLATMKKKLFLGKNLYGHNKKILVLRKIIFGHNEKKVCFSKKN